MNKKISELSEASELLEGDLLAIVQQGETKKVKAKLFCECGNANLSILDVRPGVNAGEIDLIDQGISDNFPEFKHVHVLEGDRFLFKKGNLISIHPKVIVYLSNQDQYFNLTLQIYDDEFNSIHNASIESPKGIATGEPYTLEIPTYLLTLNKSIHYIKTKLNNFVLEPIDIQVIGGDHTCYTVEEGGLVLTSSSSVTGAQYFWKVPLDSEEFFTETNVQNLTVPFNFIVGEFTVTVRDPMSGRQNSKTVLVTDRTLPSCFLVFTESNITLTATETTGTTYTWTVSNNSDWGIASGHGTNTITVVPGPIGSSALYKAVIQGIDTGCYEDCSLMLKRTPTGIIAITAGEPL